MHLNVSMYMTCIVCTLCTQFKSPVNSTQNFEILLKSFLIDYKHKKKSKLELLKFFIKNN